LDHFHDRKEGGYWWSTHLQGKLNHDCKFLYGQAFVIYALVEYFRASGDREALEQAIDLYKIIQIHLYDPIYGGWFEQGDRTWNLLAPNDPRIQFELSQCKSANAHLHWMEALAELYEATGDESVRASLIEALEMNQTYFFPENPAAYCPYREFDWKPVRDPKYNQLPYGHTVEFAWLMIRTEQVLGREPSWPRFYALLDHALELGFDAERGGLYSYGFGNERAHNREKIWWVQAELLAALSEALKHRREPRYERALEKLLDFIARYQTSPKNGIWLYSVTEEGIAKNTTKANSWKANYHDVRAMLKFIDLPLQTF
jgi:mannobiose 2-epimerase